MAPKPQTSEKVKRPASKASDAKAFSRRYDTSERHDTAVAMWHYQQDAKKARAQAANAKPANASSPELAQAQLDRLDARGDAAGTYFEAVKETRRLLAVIDAAELAELAERALANA